MSLGTSVAVDVNHWSAMKRRMRERKRKKEMSSLLTFMIL